MSAARQVWRNLCLAAIKGVSASDEIKVLARRAEYAPFPAELGYVAAEFARAFRDCARAWVSLHDDDARARYSPVLLAHANLVWGLLEPAASGRPRIDLAD